MTPQSVFDAYPVDVRTRLTEIRDLIIAAGKASDIGELEETLKWGQLSYLPKRKRVGTTVRLGWSPSDPEFCALYVHCQTDLVGRYRQIFPDEFKYVDNRAVLVPTKAAYSRSALQQIAAMALTYHRDKR